MALAGSGVMVCPSRATPGWMKKEGSMAQPPPLIFWSKPAGSARQESPHMVALPGFSRLATISASLAQVESGRG